MNPERVESLLRELASHSQPERLFTEAERTALQKRLLVQPEFSDSDLESENDPHPES